MWVSALKLLSSLLPVLLKHWKLCLVCLAVCLQLVTANGWYRDHNALNSERASHQADIRTYKKAQQDANDKAEAEKQRLEKENKAKANEADKNYSALLAKYRANLLRYKANQSVTEQPRSSEQSPASESSDGPGGSSNISITLNDAQICANNTARLMSAHDWAIHLGDTNEDATD